MLASPVSQKWLARSTFFGRSCYWRHTLTDGFCSDQCNRGYRSISVAEQGTLRYSTRHHARALPAVFGWRTTCVLQETFYTGIGRTLGMRERQRLWNKLNAEQKLKSCNNIMIMELRIDVYEVKESAIGENRNTEGCWRLEVVDCIAYTRYERQYIYDYGMQSQWKYEIIRTFIKLSCCNTIVHADAADERTATSAIFETSFKYPNWHLHAVLCVYSQCRRTCFAMTSLVSEDSDQSAIQSLSFLLYNCIQLHIQHLISSTIKDSRWSTLPIDSGLTAFISGLNDCHSINLIDTIIMLQQRQFRQRL